MFDSIFINNTAVNAGGAIYWNITNPIVNCSFINSKSHKYNGVYSIKDLTINGGNGIVYISPQETISGITIVVLNNETYYYPPNTNINFTTKKENMLDQKYQNN